MSGDKGSYVEGARGPHPQIIFRDATQLKRRDLEKQIGMWVPDAQNRSALMDTIHKMWSFEEDDIEDMIAQAKRDAQLRAAVVR